MNGKAAQTRTSQKTCCHINIRNFRFRVEELEVDCSTFLQLSSWAFMVVYDLFIYEDKEKEHIYCIMVGSDPGFNANIKRIGSSGFKYFKGVTDFVE